MSEVKSCSQKNHFLGLALGANCTGKCFFSRCARLVNLRKWKPCGLFSLVRTCEITATNWLLEASMELGAFPPFGSHGHQNKPSVGGLRVLGLMQCVVCIQSQLHQISSKGENYKTLTMLHVEIVHHHAMFGSPPKYNRSWMFVHN